jgi:hypothetical protein
MTLQPLRPGQVWQAGKIDCAPDYQRMFTLQTVARSDGPNPHWVCSGSEELWHNGQLAWSVHSNELRWIESRDQTYYAHVDHNGVAYHQRNDMSGDLVVCLYEAS